MMAFLCPPVLRHSAEAEIKDGKDGQHQSSRCTYRTTAYTWDELCDMIARHDLAALRRSARQHEEYEQYRVELRKTWKSVYDFVLCSKFQYTRCIMAKDETKWEAVVPTMMGESRTSLVPNDFPYYIAEHIEHWVLWKLGGDVTEADIEQAKQDLKLIEDSKRGVKASLHWINPPHLRSLPEIDHAHILCLRNSETL